MFSSFQSAAELKLLKQVKKKILKIDQFSLVLLLRWDSCEKIQLNEPEKFHFEVKTLQAVDDPNWDFSKAIHACVFVFERKTNALVPKTRLQLLARLQGLAS